MLIFRINFFAISFYPREQNLWDSQTMVQLAPMEALFSLHITHGYITFSQRDSFAKDIITNSVIRTVYKSDLKIHIYC